MRGRNSLDWDNATWEGSRKAQLRRSLALTPRQRFEALETMAKTSHWLSSAKKHNNDKILSEKPVKNIS